jgi:prevent-host-death family protein
MPRIKRRYSVSEARKRLPSLVREAEKGDAISLTRRGEPVAVLLSSENYTKLTADRPQLAPAIEQFRKDFDLEELDIEEIYRDVRDRTPGRDVRL